MIDILLHRGHAFAEEDGAEPLAVMTRALLPDGRYPLTLVGKADSAPAVPAIGWSASYTSDVTARRRIQARKLPPKQIKPPNRAERG